MKLFFNIYYLLLYKLTLLLNFVADLSLFQTKPVQHQFVSEQIILSSF